MRRLGIPLAKLFLLHAPHATMATCQFFNGRTSRSTQPNNEGDFDPVALTSALSIEPTESHRKGDPWNRGRTHRRTRWQVQVPKSDEVDWDDLIAPLLATFEGRDHAVRDARASLQVVGHLQIVTEMEPEKGWGGPDPDRDYWGVSTPASGFSAANIARMAQLGLSFGADMYVSLTDEMEALD